MKLDPRLLQEVGDLVFPKVPIVFIVAIVWIAYPAGDLDHRYII